MKKETSAAYGYANWARIANKAEECIFFLRQNKLTTERMVAHIRAKLETHRQKIAKL